MDRAAPWGGRITVVFVAFMALKTEPAARCVIADYAS